MNPTDHHLAPYEQRLLTELRGVVAERALAAPARPRLARPGRRVAVGLGLAAALAVAGAVGVPVVLGSGNQSAYAAEREPDGSIRILIREYSNAEGLQKRLRQLGVAAVVDYVPNGKQCREPRATYVRYDDVPRGLLTSLPPEDGEETYLKLHPELLKPGQTFVYTTTIVGDPDGDEWSAVGHVELATGPVAACELVPGPVLAPNGG